MYGCDSNVVKMSMKDKATAKHVLYPAQFD